MLENLLLGMLVGFVIALPTGPVGILCIRKTLVYGRLSGFLSVFGSVFADMFFSLVVLFGLTYISSFFIKNSILIQALGGIIFLLIAYKAYKMNVDEKAETLPLKTPVEDFLSTFTLTFTNPTFIISLSFIIALLKIVDHIPTTPLKISVLFGITVGSLLWWFVFIFIIDRIHRKHREISLVKINKISAIVLGAAGVFFLVISIFNALIHTII